MAAALIPISSLTRDPAMQMRVSGLDSAVVADYAEAMERGDMFPPVTIFSDSESFWLVDGFHRTAAAIRLGWETLQADVREGSRRDALIFSTGVNDKHGVRRTQADKRRSVMTLLQDPDFATKSDREVGKACAVDHKTVGSIRRELRGEIPTTKATTEARSLSQAMGNSPDHEGATGSMVERMLGRATDASLLAECRRRGWEVAHEN